MAKVYYSVTIILLLLIINACGPGSPPTMINPSYYQLTVKVDPDEGGTVSLQSDEFTSGSEVEISATPTEGWLFDSWQGDHSGSSNPATVIMDEDKEITAIFLKREYPLTITVKGEGTVDEKIVQSKTTDHPHGTIVELTAEPAMGWRFTEWEGAQNHSGNPVKITVDEAKEITAVFEKDFFRFTIEAEGQGIVDNTLLSGNMSDGLYEYGSVIELRASASAGWGFSQWEGDFEGDQNPVSVTIDAHKNIAAIFITTNSDFSGGSGTETDPYRISTIDQLQSIDEPKYLDSHFIQINNINAVSTSNWNRRKGFKPIGSDSPFRGTFDGNGYEISRLTIDRDDEDNVGLFSSVENGIIKNTGLINTQITGDEVVGGLVGNNNGQIINSYVLGEINGEEEVGGLAGRNHGQILESYALADVSGEDEIGGLVGRNHREISSSYSEGSVFGKDDRIGGLVGYNIGEINNSYSHSRVTGDEKTGGLVGENRSGGGIEFSYTTGQVTGDKHVGGLIGSNRGSISASYWDRESTGVSGATGRGSSTGTTGLRSSEMKGSAAEDNMTGFDWDDIWRRTSGYPILSWQ